MSSSEPGPAYDGLEGLRRANPVAVAAAVFVDVFAGASLADPNRSGIRLEQSILRLAGIPLRTGGLVRAASWLGLAAAGSPQRRGSLGFHPFVAETLTLWQLTRVAASLPAGTPGTTVLVMMRRGEDLLRAEHPAGFLRDLLLAGPAEY